VARSDGRPWLWHPLSAIADLGFDPAVDIAAVNGCWHWVTDKPALHRYVADYFHGRREDG
jgi:hypothetical protein